MMKLDYNCIRSILLKIESSENEKLMVNSFCSDQYTPQIISGHIECLLDVGYIAASGPHRVLSVKCSDYIVERITMQGHEYLNTVRDDKVWKKTLKKIGGSTVSISLELIKDIATGVIKGMLSI